MLKHTINDFLKKHGLAVSIYIVLVMIIGNSIFAIVFRNRIVANIRIKEQVIQANQGIENMNTNINLADMGLRGYMIIQDDGLLNPMVGAVENSPENLENLRAVLSDLGYDVSKMDASERVIRNYTSLVQDMAAMCRRGDVESAVDILKRDPGYEAWAVYSVFDRDARQYINMISEQTNTDYTRATIRLIIVQAIFMIISVPILLFTLSSFRSGRKFRHNLFEKLHVSNQKYIFDSGENETDTAKDEAGIIDVLISNLQLAADFITRITNGEYDIAWKGLNKNNAHLNTDNIAGKLSNMRDQMKRVKEEDEKRLWTSQGLSDFATIIRKNQHDFKTLSEELIRNIVKYLDAQMGGLFILNDDDRDHVYLELQGCYAYERIKTVEKHVEPGEGLVGQCYLEGETIYMTNVPQDFVNITSGLGDARPECVLIVPLKLNDRMEGVIELASLQPFESHEIDFIEKLGESLASAISTVRSAENTRILLEQSQQQAEEMRAQEEEMRQNMEELQATQEQMERKNDEIEKLLEQASEREELMKRQNEVILEEKSALETEKAVLSTLMQLLPERITIKDDKGRYMQISEAKYKTLRQQGYKNMIGKSDKDIFGPDHFEKSFAVEKELMKSGKAVVDVEERIKISDDQTIWGLTSRVPFVDTNGKVLGTIAITRDITQLKECEEELARLKQSDN